MKKPRVIIPAIIFILGALLIISEFNNWVLVVYLSKITTILLCMFLVLATPITDTTKSYKYAIFIGLVFSLAGDMLLVPQTRIFIIGLILFLIAHLFYIRAFTSQGGFSLSLRQLVPFVLFGIGIYILLLPGLGDMKIPVLVYLMIILTMGWQALGNMIRGKKRYAMLAFIGALLFMISDTFIAIDNFYYKFENWRIIIISTYFAAQCLLALSVNHKE